MIPFPKLHIAESVLNRIFNTLDGEPPLVTPIEPLVIPDPTIEGAEIDAEVQAQAPPVSAPPGTEQDVQNGIESSALTGGSPFDGAVLGALGQ